MSKWICPPNCPDRKVTADYNCHSHCEKHLKYQLQQKLRRKIGFRYAMQRQAEFEAKRNVRKIAQRLEKKDRDRGNIK